MKNLAKYFAIIFLIHSSLIFSQQEFDIADVVSKNCKKEGDFNCFTGYKFLTPAEKRSIPVSPKEHVQHRGLPSKIDLSPYLPPVGNQGGQGSCAQWSAVYYMKSYHEKLKRKWEYDAPVNKGEGEHVFSPAYTYNQVNGGSDRGSNQYQAFELGKKQGIAPWKYMPYDSRDYRTQPNSVARAQAAKYKNRGSRFADGISGIKAELAAGNLIGGGIAIYHNFNILKPGDILDHSEGKSLGGHAITLVGYDDSKVSRLGHRGALKFVNSWGTHWGDKGYGWISYDYYTAARGGGLILDNGDQEPIVPVADKIGPPLQVTATQGSYSDKILIQWKAVEKAVSYEVRRAMPGESSFISLGFAQYTSFEDKSIQASVSYKYIVIAISENAKSNPNESPIAQGYASPAEDKNPPAKVADLTGAEVNSSIVLSWTAQEGVTTYNIFRYNTSRNQWINAGQSKKNQFTDKAAPIGMNYYSVNANNAAGSGPFADTISVTRNGGQVLPDTVSGFSVTQGTHKDKVELSWNRLTGVDFYYVAGYNTSQKKWEEFQNTRQTSYTYSNDEIKNGVKYYFTVLPHNASGFGKYSEMLLGYASPFAQRAGDILAAPEGVVSKIDVEKRRVTLTWKPVKNAAEYYVFRGIDTASNFTFTGKADAPQNSFSDTLPPEDGKLVFYTVRTKSASGGESNNSKIVTAFINKKIPVLKFRSTLNTGSEKFIGKWQAFYADGIRQPVTLALNIREDNGNLFVSLAGPGANFEVKGRYAAGAESLSFKGLYLQLVGSNKQFLNVQVTDKKLFRDELDLVFTR